MQFRKTRQRLHGHGRWVGVGVSAVMLSSLAVASSASAAGSGVTKAKSLVAQAEKPVSGPSVPPFNAAKLKGEKVWFVSLSLSIPYSQQVLSGVKQASQALGIKVTSFDGQDSASQVSRGIGLAVAAKANAIIVHSIPGSQVAPAVQAAKQAGIKVISAETQNPGPRPAGHAVGRERARRPLVLRQGGRDGSRGDRRFQRTRQRPVPLDQ